MRDGLPGRLRFGDREILLPDIKADHESISVLPENVIAAAGPKRHLNIKRDRGGVVQAGQRLPPEKGNLWRELQAVVTGAQDQLLGKHGQSHAGEERYQQPPESYLDHGTPRQHLPPPVRTPLDLERSHSELESHN
jgi:hypothetical protein